MSTRMVTRLAYSRLQLFCAAVAAVSVGTAGVVVSRLYSFNEQNKIKIIIPDLSSWGQVSLGLASSEVHEDSITVNIAKSVVSTEKIKRRIVVVKRVVTSVPTVKDEKKIEKIETGITEAATMLAIYQNLRTQFFLVMSTQTKMDTQVAKAEAAPIKPSVAIKVVRRTKPPAIKMAAIQRDAIVALPLGSAIMHTEPIRKDELNPPNAPVNTQIVGAVTTQTPQSACPRGLGKQDSARQVDAVMAFDSNSHVFVAKSEVLSYEGDTCNDHGKWISTYLPGYLNTLYWQGPKMERDPVPIISSNALLMLSKLSSTPQQSTAGIVFGKVPKGWSVELSGRAETPVYFSDGRGLVSSNNMNTQRSFVFLNAAPGAHLLFLRGGTGQGGPAIALPVLSGHATYVALDEPVKYSITGRVLSARSGSGKGQENIKVKIVGQEAYAATTSKNGAFNFENVMAIQNFPVFIETASDSGFTHRHRVTVGSNKDLLLFQFGPAQIRKWLNQLEGGVSPTSGIVIAAMPGLARENPDTSLYASLSPLLGTSTLLPETYSLSHDDKMITHRPLDLELPRFISVQAPEGSNVGRIEDKEGKIIWSEFIFSSPGVVNVIGSE